MLMKFKSFAVSLLVVQALAAPGEGNSRARDLVCATSSACPNPINLQPNQRLFCTGRRSCRYKTIVGNGKNIVECLGHESCQYTKFQLNAESKVYCAGYEACEHADIEEDINAIYGWGYRSLYSLDVETGNKVGFVDAGGAYSAYTFDGDDVVKRAVFGGSYSGFVSNMRSKGEDVHLEFNGFESARSKQFWCEGGSKCVFNCVQCYSSNGLDIYVSPTSKLVLKCPYEEISCGRVDVHYESGAQVVVKGPGKNDVNQIPSGARRRLDNRDTEAEEAEAMDEGNPEVQVLQEEHKGALRKLSSSVTCDDYKECDGQELSTHKTYLNCYGTLSCNEMVVSRVTFASLHGYKAMQNGKISSSRYLYAYGQKSLLNAEVNARVLYAYGIESARGATIHLDDDSNTYKYVFGYGTGSVRDAVITCGEGKNCLVYCYGRDSCVDTVLDCTKTEDRCEPRCNAASGCPKVIYSCPRRSTESDCHYDDLCFWASGVCVWKREESCASLSIADCVKADFCSYKNEQCVYTGDGGDGAIGGF